MHQLNEAKKRLAEVQRVQEEQLKRKDHRDMYVQAMRTNSQHALNRTHSKERTVQALDLELGSSRLPKVSSKKDLPPISVPGESKIPRINKPAPQKTELLWEKGDLLDSLDLSSTKMKEQLMHFQQIRQTDEPREEKVKEEDGKDKFWLGKSIRQSIKEWAPTNPVLKENQQAPEPKSIPQAKRKPVTLQTPPIIQQEATEYEDEIRSVISVPTNSTHSKASKKVTEIRGRVQRQRVVEDTFLNQELHCIEEEEKKMLQSIDRLDKELVGITVVDHLVDYTSKPRPKNISPAQEESLVQDSVAKLSDILEKRSEAGTDTGSVVSAPYSVYSAPTAAALKIKSEGVTIEDLKRERTQSSGPVKRIGAVYNEVAAISGRYNDQNPPPSYALRKAKARVPISFRKPPIARPKYTNVVEVNPRVNLKEIFQDDDQDLPPWAE